jgi:hypothetical protein
MDMKFGKGNISAWSAHYNEMVRSILGSRYTDTNMLIVNFIKASENKRRQSMGPGTKENLRRVRELEALDTNTHHDGWDKCHIPVKNIFRYDDKPENCPACGGLQARISEKLSVTLQFLNCRDCGANFVRPIRDGAIITSEEEEI